MTSTSTSTESAFEEFTIPDAEPGAAVPDTPDYALPDIEEIQAKSVIVVLALHGIGNHRKVLTKRRQDMAVGEVAANDGRRAVLVMDTEADEKLIGVTKKLMDASEYTAIASLDGAIRDWIKAVCLPSPLKKGTYTAPITLVLVIEDQMKRFLGTREQLVEKLIAAWQRIKGEAKERLKELYRESDYYSEADLRRLFRMSWRYVRFGTPDVLSDLDPEFYRREMDKLDAVWAQTGVEMREALRVGAEELVNDLLDRLKPESKKGKKKQFRTDGILQRFDDFIATFRARDLTNDRQLNVLVEQARQILEGVTPKELNKQKSLRETVQQQFVEVRKGLAKLTVVEAPSRLITLMEDDDES